MMMMMMIGDLNGGDFNEYVCHYTIYLYEVHYIFGLQLPFGRPFLNVKKSLPNIGMKMISSSS